jgi:hypothetical protein
MNAHSQILVENGTDEPLLWCARVLTSFAEAEQALGRLCLALGLSIESGSLSNLAQLRDRLERAEGRRYKLLIRRLDRWSANRPYRNLLAHATLHTLADKQGRQIVVTRHLPRDTNDVTPDRMWTEAERTELLREATSDGRSIADLVRNILDDAQLLKVLRA